MTTYVEGRRVTSETEPIGLLTEGAAGIAVIVLAIISLADVSAGALISIATIVIGVGLMVQGFNTAAESSRAIALGNAAGAPVVSETSGDVMVNCLSGIVGIVLGILALIGVDPAPLLPAALIVFGSALLLGGAMAMRGPVMGPVSASGTQMVTYHGSSATGGMGVLIGIAAIVLGILALVLAHAGVLVMVGYIAVGAALLMISATVSSAMLRIFAGTAQ